MFDIIYALIPRFTPLALYIALGYAAGRLTSIKGSLMAWPLFYVVIPFVVFFGVMHTQISWNLLSLPVVVWGMGSLLCLLTYRLAKPLWSDATPNLLGLAAGTGNTGYFGLPVAFTIFDEQGVGIYLFALTGLELYEASIGFYVMSRGRQQAREILPRLVRLPLLWAFILGTTLNAMGFKIPESLAPVESYCRFAYSILGMLVIGISLSMIRSLSIDWRFLSLSFVSKFVIWPIAIGLLYLTHLYPAPVYQALLLIAIVPIATNTVVMSTLFGGRPDQAAAAVILSVLFAFLFVPFIFSWIL